MVGVLTPTLLPFLQKNYTPKVLTDIGRILSGPRMVRKPKYIIDSMYPYYKNVTTKSKWPSTKIEKGKLPDEVRDALPIKPSSTAKFMGFLGVPIGARKQRFKHMDPIWRRPEFGWFVDEGNKHCDYRITAKGAWGTQTKNFQELCDPVPEIDIDQYWNAAQKRLHKIKLPKISHDIVEEHVYAIGTKAKSSAGLFAQLNGLGATHKIADKYIKPCAAHVFRQASENRLVDSTLWTIGGRGRTNKVTDETIGTEINSRVVMMPDGVSKIIGLAISGTWMKHIVKINKDNPENEIAVGLDFMNNRYHKLSTYIRSFETQFEVDWKAFDTRVTENLLVLAFAILRACYPDGKKYDNLFFFMASGTIFKNVVIPGGFIYRLTKSIPSGSPWTTALGCIINWLIWCKIYEDIPYDTHVTCYGDDTLGCIDTRNYIYNPFNEAWFRMKINETPMVGKGLKLYDKFSEPTPYDGPTLLKAYDCGGLPARRRSDFFETLLYGGGSGLRHSRSMHDFFEKTKGALYNNPFSLHTFDMLKELLITIGTLAYSEGRNGARSRETARSMVTKMVNNSIRIARNRYLQDQFYDTPKVKIALPWLDEQKFYCKKFVPLNADLLKYLEVYIREDIDVISDGYRKIGTFMSSTHDEWLETLLHADPPRFKNRHTKALEEPIEPTLEKASSFEHYFEMYDKYARKMELYLKTRTTFFKLKVDEVDRKRLEREVNNGEQYIKDEDLLMLDSLIRMYPDYGEDNDED